MYAFVNTYISSLFLGNVSQVLDNGGRWTYIISMKSTKAQAPFRMDEFQQLISGALPSPSQLLVRLTKFHALLYDGFGQASARAGEFLKGSHNKKTSKWFRPQAIRFCVHDFLAQKGIEAQLVDENDEIEDTEPLFEPIVLPGNGIAGSVYGYEYRVLKAYQGGLPPAISQKRKDYYNQKHLKVYEPVMRLFDDELWIGKTRILKPNLVYVWELVKGQVKLYLAVPKHYALYKTTPLVFVPNPITTMRAEPDNLVEEDTTDNTYAMRNVEE